MGPRALRSRFTHTKAPLGLPLSTSVGCEGLYVKDGVEILIADTPQGFADAVLRLLKDPALRAGLRERGRALVEVRYGWDVIGETL